jgi:hypothetical protein
MRLTTVLASVDNNPNYYMFIPKQILFWNKFGIKFLAIFVGKKIPKELIKYSKNIILWDKNLDINTSFVGQNIRIYYPAILNLLEDEIVMITDMDMLPCSSNFYKDGLEYFTKEDFIYYRSIDEINKQIYMCYNAAHPDVWSKCFEIKNIEDIERNLYKNYTDSYNSIPCKERWYEGGWYTDQILMFNSLINYPYLKILNRPLRRLEVHMYTQHLYDNDTNFYMNYDDAHFHRNYFSNLQLIENAQKQMDLCD